MRFLRKLHKWLGLIVGLQLLLWAVSGLVFAWLNHHEVAGEHAAHPPEPAVLGPSVALAEPANWISEGPAKNPISIRLMPILDRWVWRVESAEGVTLRDAATSEVFQFSEELIREVAQRHYIGEGSLESVTFHSTPTLETRDSPSAWEARFDDENATTLYFAGDDGRLVETRNDTWRLFDFFWMLHTMDYRGRDDFNNPLVITIGFAALWLSLSGFLLLFRSFRRQDFAFLTAWRRGT
jgi:uncharacterized iron-regulated membrane protein